MHGYPASLTIGRFGKLFVSELASEVGTSGSDIIGIDTLGASK